MRIIIASVLLFTLTSCTNPTSTPDNTPLPPPVPTTMTSSTNTGEAVPATPTVASSGSVVTLNYTLRTDSESGPIQETTLETVAKANALYKTGAAYQAFQVILGQNQVISGFENGLMGVKKGDKKIIKVIPSEGYGRPLTIPKEKIAPEYSITQKGELLQDTIRKTIAKSEFPAEMQAKAATAKVGDTFTGANNITARVVAVASGSLTMEIENNINNPFYKKERRLGSVVSTEGGDLKITSIDGDDFTILIKDKSSPFYGKKFAVGESVTPENGRKITITEITDKTVSIIVDHPLMAKDLYFDVEIVDVQ